MKLRSILAASAISVAACAHPQINQTAPIMEPVLAPARCYTTHLYSGNKFATYINSCNSSFYDFRPVFGLYMNPNFLFEEMYGSVHNRPHNKIPRKPELKNPVLPPGIHKPHEPQEPDKRKRKPEHEMPTATPYTYSTNPIALRPMPLAHEPLQSSPITKDKSRNETSRKIPQEYSPRNQPDQNRPNYSPPNRRSTEIRPPYTPPRQSMPAPQYTPKPSMPPSKKI